MSLWKYLRDIYAVFIIFGLGFPTDDYIASLASHKLIHPSLIVHQISCIICPGLISFNPCFWDVVLATMW